MMMDYINHRVKEEKRSIRLQWKLFHQKENSL